MTLGVAGRFGTALVMAITAHASAGAQVARPLVTAADRFEAREQVPPALASASTPQRGRREPPPGPGRSIATTASVIGGAVVGAWLGYFVSQVVKSDWEGARGGDRAVHRRQFAFSGAAIGAVAGYLVRPRPRAPGVAEPRPPFFYVPRSSRHFITRVELRRAPVVNALEAVQALRPEWLGAAAQAATQPDAGDAPSAAGAADVDVYVVDTRIGGAETLADISIPELEELRLYEPQDAERRWRVTGSRRAIEVVPLGAAPR